MLSQLSAALSGCPAASQEPPNFRSKSDRRAASPAGTLASACPYNDAASAGLPRSWASAAAARSGKGLAASISPA